MIKWKIFITVFMLFLSLMGLQAKNMALTNKVEYSWSNLDRSYGKSTNVSMVTDYYKLDLFLSPGADLSITPGITNHVLFTLWNVGSIDETNGIDLSSFFDTNFGSISITSNSNTPLAFMSNIASLASGSNIQFWVNISVKSNTPIGSYSFSISNKSSPAPYPYPLAMGYSNSIRIQNITVFSAFDGIHTVYSNQFDGTGLLGNLDVTVDMVFEIDPSTAYLYYDVGADPDGSAPSGTVTKNRMVNIKKVGNIYRAVIPVLDPEIKAGAEVRFIIKADGDNNYYSGTLPFSYFVSNYKSQPPDGDECNIILNNVGDLRDTPARVIYCLYRASFVNITVFNLRGEIIKVLKNEMMGIGKYYESWSGNNDNGFEVSAGLYFVVINTAENRVMKKILFVKR